MTENVTVSDTFAVICREPDRQTDRWISNGITADAPARRNSAAASVIGQPDAVSSTTSSTF